MDACVRRLGAAIYFKNISLGKICCLFFLFSIKRKKENQIVWINPFTLKLLWKETRSCQNLTKCFGWLLLFWFFFPPHRIMLFHQEYPVLQGCINFSGKVSVWHIFVTCGQFCYFWKKMPNKKLNLSNLKTHFHTISFVMLMWGAWICSSTEQKHLAKWTCHCSESST